MIINAITGYSASVRKRSKILPAFIEDVLSDMGDQKPVHIERHYVYSSTRGCIQESLKFIHERPLEPVLLVGKSLGAIRTWWMLYQSWGDLVGRASKIGVVLIDPHGWQVGDKTSGSYCKRKSLPWKSGWDDSGIRITVLYQWNKYPTGAKMQGGHGWPLLYNFKLDSKATHWNVTSIKSQAGMDCAHEIQKMIKWLDS